MEARAKKYNKKMTKIVFFFFFDLFFIFNFFRKFRFGKCFKKRNIFFILILQSFKKTPRVYKDYKNSKWKLHEKYNFFYASIFFHSKASLNLFHKFEKDKNSIKIYK